MAGQCHVFSVHWLVLECCENSISFSSGLIISLTLVFIFVQSDHICKHAHTMYYICSLSLKYTGRFVTLSTDLTLCSLCACLSILSEEGGVVG